MVRVKYRYILLEIILEEFENERLLKLPVMQTAVYWAINRSIGALYGDYGAGLLQMGTAIKLVNPYTRLVFIKAKRGPHRMLCAAIPFVKHIKKVQCCLRILHIGGTFRSTKKFLRRYFRQELFSILEKCSSDEEKSQVHQEITSSLKSLKEASIQDSGPVT